MPGRVKGRCLWQEAPVKCAATVGCLFSVVACVAPSSNAVDSGLPVFQDAVALTAGQGALDVVGPSGSVAAQLHVYGAPLNLRLVGASWGQARGVLGPAGARPALPQGEGELNPPTRP